MGYALVVWATASNAFFSLIVRIQTERGQSVVSWGPYAHVRHPAYAGGVLTNVFTPILLGSAWALLLGVLDALLMILRTVLEDRTLKAELPGYPEYALRVRYRLLPHFW
jgi:protein-S-isoprenylcysteine O-methyltransferase Ste14